jgi:hypothetical protein
MYLKMLVGNDLIDLLPVDFNNLLIPGYLEGLKQQLEEKHAGFIKSSLSRPLFFVDNVPSSMNQKNKDQ